MFFRWSPETFRPFTPIAFTLNITKWDVNDTIEFIVGYGRHKASKIVSAPCEFLTLIFVLYGTGWVRKSYHILMFFYVNSV